MGEIAFYSSTFAGATLATLAITPLTIRLAHARGLLDIPTMRKVHTTPIPRAGGIAIAIGATLAAVIALMMAHPLPTRPTSEFGSQVLAILVASIAVFLIGFADDVKSIPSKWKLLVLAAAAATVVSAGVRIRVPDIGAGMNVQAGALSWIVTIFWIVAVPVSLNFIDGLDGLAAGITVLAAFALAAGAGLSHSMPATVLALALAGALSGFLRYNLRPARIFMGDGGSLFIGFLLGCASVLATGEVGVRRGILLPACALTVPFMDTALTVIRRGVLQRRSLFSAERGHVHHRLLDNGLCHLHAVLALYAVSVALAMIGLVAGFARIGVAVMAVSAAVALACIFFHFAGSTRAGETIAAVRRNRGLARETARNQATFDEMQTRFKVATTFSQWWEQLCIAAEMLGFTDVMLPMVGRDGSACTLHWSHPLPNLTGAQLMRATVPIPDRRAPGVLNAEVQIAAKHSLESTGRALSLFFRLVTENGLTDLPDPVAACSAQLLPANGPSANEANQSVPPPDDESHIAINPLGKDVRVAIVHDFLYTYAGAEHVLEQILAVFPNSDLFSLFDFLPAGQRGFIHEKPVTTSFIQKLPFARKRHRAYLPLMPLAIEQLDVSNYDVVISSSYLVAKGILTRPDQLHVCYCHSPARFAWDLQNQYLNRAGMTLGLRSLIARSLLHYIRIWDSRSANGVDLLLTNSAFVSRRIDKVYRRRSLPIYPPVAIEKFTMCKEKEDFYLTASRMVPYKRIDLIVEAFSKMPDKRIIVVGEGPEQARLKAIAGPNVRFVGHQSLDRLKTLMQRARAFVFAAEEDFGIVPVEAQACGTPVIAFGRGGVLESVIDGRTGTFFPEQTSQSLIDAVKQFELREWDSVVIRKNAERFSTTRFRDEFAAAVSREWERFELAKSVRPTMDPPMVLGLGEVGATQYAKAAKARHADAEASSVG